MTFRLRDEKYKLRQCEVMASSSDRGIEEAEFKCQLDLLHSFTCY